MVMDAKLHLKDKNCDDLLQIDPESEATYGVSTLLMQFCFAGARNKKIDRYIPIEEIRDALKKGLRKWSDMDIDLFIDEYLKKEEKQKAIVATNVDKLSEETKIVNDNDDIEERLVSKEIIKEGNSSDYISDSTLFIMDQAVENLYKNKISDPIDLSEFSIITKYDEESKIFYAICDELGLALESESYLDLMRDKK